MFLRILEFYAASRLLSLLGLQSRRAVLVLLSRERAIALVLLSGNRRAALPRRGQNAYAALRRGRLLGGAAQCLGRLQYGAALALRQAKHGASLSRASRCGLSGQPHGVVACHRKLLESGLSLPGLCRLLGQTERDHISLPALRRIRPHLNGVAIS